MKKTQNKANNKTPGTFIGGKTSPPCYYDTSPGCGPWSFRGSPRARPALPRPLPRERSRVRFQAPSPHSCPTSPRRPAGLRLSAGARYSGPPPHRLRSPAGRRGQPRGRLRGSAPPRPPWFPWRPAGPARSCRPRAPPAWAWLPAAAGVSGAAGSPAPSRIPEAGFPAARTAGPGQGERLPLSLASRWLPRSSGAVAGTAQLSLQLAGQQFQQTVVRGSPALLHTAVLPAE